MKLACMILAAASSLETSIAYLAPGQLIFLGSARPWRSKCSIASCACPLLEPERAKIYGVSGICTAEQYSVVKNSSGEYIPLSCARSPRAGQNRKCESETVVPGKRTKPQNPTKTVIAASNTNNQRQLSRPLAPSSALIIAT